jgi:opacity protein-like surface antigen
MHMKNIAIGIGSVLLFSFSALAEENEAPRMEVFLGYTFTRANSATDIPSFDANGGSGQFVYNFNHWLGAVLDMGAVHNGNIHGISLDSTAANFLLGPRVAVRKWSRIAPYFQTLFGGVYATTSTAVPGLGLTEGLPAGFNLRATRDQTAFGMTAGGGLDIKMSKHVSFRPVQIEYFLTRLHDYRSATDNSQNNIRYSAGFNFTFGEAQ